MGSKGSYVLLSNDDSFASDVYEGGFLTLVTYKSWFVSWVVFFTIVGVLVFFIVVAREESLLTLALTGLLLT